MKPAQYSMRGRAWPAIIAILALLCGVAACNSKEDNPDVSKIEVRLQTARIDRALASIDTNHIAEGLARLDQEYPNFFRYYIDTMLGYNIHGPYATDNPEIDEKLRFRFTYHDFRNLFDTVAAHFPDTKQIDEDITRGYQYLLYYYPGSRVPRFYYVLSNLSGLAAFTFGDTASAGVALDMYLGKDFPFYTVPSVGYPAYKARTFEPEYAAVNFFNTLWHNEHPFTEEGATLLDMMLQRGREQYYLSKILPFKADSLRFGYTAAQMQWCKDNETMIYATLAQEQAGRGPLLYERAWNMVRALVNEGPVSPGMPPEAPGNVGAYIGYRIIEAWAARHPETPLPEVLKVPSDPQKFLEDSGYKP